MKLSGCRHNCGCKRRVALPHKTQDVPDQSRQHHHVCVQPEHDALVAGSVHSGVHSDLPGKGGVEPAVGRRTDTDVVAGGVPGVQRVVNRGPNEDVIVISDAAEIKGGGCLASGARFAHARTHTHAHARARARTRAQKLWSAMHLHCAHTRLRNHVADFDVVLCGKQ